MLSGKSSARDQSEVCQYMNHKGTIEAHDPPNQATKEGDSSAITKVAQLYGTITGHSDGVVCRLPIE